MERINALLSLRTAVVILLLWVGCGAAIRFGEGLVDGFRGAPAAADVAWPERLWPKTWVEGLDV